MLSRKIDRILIADAEPARLEQLGRILNRHAPHALIRSTTTQADTQIALAQWRPVLVIARLQLLMDSGRCVLEHDLQRGIALPPFILAVSDNSASTDIVEAMRCGVSHVMEWTPDESGISAAIVATVSSLSCLDVQLNRILAPQLYSDQTPFSLKQLNNDIEQHVFKLAFGISHSKNGISKLLGISRQLVQYHLKKISE